MAVAEMDWSKVKALKSYDGSGVVRNEDADDESESGEGASKQFDE